MRKWLIFFGVLLLIVGLGGMWWKEGDSILNPLSGIKNNKSEKKEVKIFGFLPTWMVGKTRIYTNEITHLVFLGIESDEEGNLIWDTQSKKINSETFLDQKQKISENGGKNILGIKLFDDEKLKILLTNEESGNNLVKQIKEVVKEDGFDGVNIDFEFQNDPLAILEEDFGQFLNKLNLAEVGEISVDVFANTVIKGDADKLKVFLEKIDNLEVMAYDFHRPGVDFAGSVAPISSNAGERSISEVVEKIISANLDKSKIIMAYPLYGYEWKTYTKDFGSQIKRGWYQMSSWNRTKELIKEKGLESNWDELSMTPWLVFEENGQIHQIYFENERSLKAKLDLVEQNQLGGYGFWALGYEGDDTSIWSY